MLEFTVVKHANFTELLRYKQCISYLFSFYMFKSELSSLDFVVNRFFL